MLLVACAKPKLKETVGFLVDNNYETYGFAILDTISVPCSIPKQTEAIFLTSSTPVSLIKHNNLPTYCVGENTAKKAKKAGFNVVYTGTGNAKDMAIDLKKLALAKNCWHPTSAVAKDDWYKLLPNINIHKSIAYIIKPEKNMPADLIELFNNKKITDILLMSPIGARTFAQLIVSCNLDVSNIKLITFSMAVMAEVKNFPFAQKITLPSPNLASINQI